MSTNKSTIRYTTGIALNPGTIREGYHIDAGRQSARELELVHELSTLPNNARRTEIYKELAAISPARWSW